MIRSKQAKEKIQERVTKAAATRRKKKEHLIASGRAYVAHNRKYDWPIIKGLYMAGMQPDDLLKLPECAEMSKAYLSHKIAIEKWAVERRALNDRTAMEVGMTLHERMKNATEEHYKFMLKEIEDERRIIANRLKTTGLQDQQARLDLLADFEGLARKTLGLDDISANDPTKNSFNAMIVIQNIPIPVKALEGQSGAMPLPSNKNVTAGNLMSGNGQDEGDIEGEFEGMTGEQAEGSLVLSSNDKQRAGDRRAGAEELLKSWRLGRLGN